ncbi:MAG: hypothetical protein JSS02_14545, partial [Planctomycetes bacterium]|nr:hypothetical protein [Planctomycetota bacterium]
MSTRILVTGSCTFFAARLIHDLGRRGAIVTAADSLPISAGKASKYVSHRLRVPKLSEDPGGYLEAIVTELRRRPYDLLLPTFEEALLLAEYQDELRSHARLLLPDFSTMYQLHHKPSLHGLCTKLDLPTPPTMVIDHADQLSAVSAHLKFPVVLKLPAANNAVGRTFCDDKAELLRRFDSLAAEQKARGGESPFVQQKIRGQMICTLSYCLKGRKLAEVVYRTARMFPEAGGTAAHRESIVHPRISQIAEQLISATQWTGFLGLDFLIDEETQIPYLIDANTRANPAIHLGFCAGVDWSRIILDLAADRFPEVQSARAGVNVHTLLIDLSWLLEGMLARAGGLKGLPARCWQMLFPGWPVHSRDDLLGIGELAAAAVVGGQAVYAGLKSLITGRQTGHLLLEHANYDPASAAAYRARGNSGRST